MGLHFLPNISGKLFTLAAENGQQGYVIILEQQTLFQLVIQIINTCILCFILYKILYKPVLEFLNARKEKIANQIDDAALKLEEAENLKKEYEIKLSEIEKERSTILEDARIEAKENGKRIVDEASKEAKTLKDRAMKDIEREQDKAKDGIKTQIVELSSLMSKKFISEKITKDEQEKLINETIASLEDVEWIG